MPHRKTTIPLPSRPLPLTAGIPVVPPTVHHGRMQPMTMARPATVGEGPAAAERATLHAHPAGVRRVDLGLEDADVAQVPVQLAEVEAVADDELSGMVNPV